jgi:hypothetical protein
MTRQVYVSLELDHERLGRLVAPDNAEAELDGFLGFLAGDPIANDESRELEDFLRQRQGHVLGRADRA